MLHDEKPPLDDALLLHYGTKGMKWGRRKGKSTTGVSRFRGAIIDRNTRQARMFKNARAGKGSKVSSAIGKKLLGEDRWKKNMSLQIKNLNAQSKRMRTGKLTVADRMDLTLNVSALDLVVSRTPR